MKRPELLLPTAQLLVSGCAHRQIARSLGCAASTITRLSRRLGNHAPVVEDFGNVDDIAGRVRQAQQHVVVLSAVILAAATANILVADISQLIFLIL